MIVPVRNSPGHCFSTDTTAARASTQMSDRSRHRARRLEPGHLLDAAVLDIREQQLGPA